MTLTNEQLESILAGEQGEPAGLDAAERQGLDEARAVRARLKSAFASVTAGAPLTRRIATALHAAPGAETAPPPTTPSRGRVIRLARWLAPVGVAAAVLVATAFLDFGGAPAAAAPAELARIHDDNLAEAKGFFRAGDAGQVAEHLRAGVGFVPRVAAGGAEAKLVGCSVAEFHGRATATYLLAVAGEKISVIVTDEAPQEMGLVCGCGCGLRDCECFHTGQCGGNNIISVRVAGRTYSAVGAASSDVLKGVLRRLQV